MNNIDKYLLIAFIGGIIFLSYLGKNIILFVVSFIVFYLLLIYKNNYENFNVIDKNKSSNKTPTLDKNTEGFSNQKVTINDDKSVSLKSVLDEEFQKGTRQNPFSNVLLTDIMDNPDKKPAPPAFNVDVSEEITNNVKKSVQRMNPTIENTNKQLFGDLWDKFDLDQSNRIFYSMPNTKVANDGNAFAKYLYGDMPSAKEDTPEGNMRRYADAYRYTLY